MPVLMPKLTRTTNGDWLARKVIPSELRDAYAQVHGVRQEARFRRPGTMPQGQAKAEFTEWLAEVEGRLALLRQATRGQEATLSQRQLQALSGEWYTWFVSRHSDNPGHVDDWDFRYDQIQDALESSGGDFNPDADNDDEPSLTPRHRARVHAKLLELSLLPSFLADKGLRLAGETQDQLLDVLRPDFIAALSLLRRRAGGDYAPDLRPQRFAQDTPRTAGKLAGMNVWEAFEAWVKERKPAAATVNRWRGVFEALNEYVEGRDVAAVSDDDAIAWKDTLTTDTRGARVVNEVWLTAAKTVFNWVKAQKKITSNPFEGVRVAVARGNTKARDPDFTDEEAAIILRAALRSDGSRPMARATRWVPWLCAYTGARAGEMAQLRKEDVWQHRRGFWVANITPEAGTVKGQQARQVVLHDHLVEQGFLDMVSASQAGPLFYRPAGAAKLTSQDPLKPPRPPYVVVRQKLGEWTRKAGVTDPNVSPNHGWRHTFKRRAARAGIEQRIRDAFCGHSSDHVGAIYETPSIEDLAHAIKVFPRYRLDLPATGQSGAE